MAKGKRKRREQIRETFRRQNEQELWAENEKRAKEGAGKVYSVDCELCPAHFQRSSHPEPLCIASWNFLKTSSKFQDTHRFPALLRNYCKPRGDVMAPAPASHHLWFASHLPDSSLTILWDTAYALPLPVHPAGCWTPVALFTERCWADLYFTSNLPFLAQYLAYKRQMKKWILHLSFVSFCFLIYKKEVGRPISVPGSEDKISFKKVKVSYRLNCAMHMKGSVIVLITMCNS